MTSPKGGTKILLLLLSISAVSLAWDGTVVVDSRTLTRAPAATNSAQDSFCAFDLTVRPSNFSSRNINGREEFRLLLSAACVDSMGQRLTDCDIALSIQPVDFSGGHAHNNPGRGAGHLVRPGVSCLPDGTRCADFAGANSGPTGYLDFDYVASEEGGRVDLTLAGSKPGHVITPRTFAIGVVFSGFSELPTIGEGYEFSASTLHDQNHHGNTGGPLQVLSVIVA